jgi:hypothetical protein
VVRPSKIIEVGPCCQFHRECIPWFPSNATHGTNDSRYSRLHAEKSHISPYSIFQRPCLFVAAVANFNPSSSAYYCPHCWGTGLPYGLHIKRTGQSPPHRPSAGWWVLTTANAAGNNGSTCLPKYGGGRINFNPLMLITNTEHMGTAKATTLSGY